MKRRILKTAVALFVMVFVSSVLLSTAAFGANMNIGCSIERTNQFLDARIDTSTKLAAQIQVVYEIKTDAAGFMSDTFYATYQDRTEQLAQQLLNVTDIKAAVSIDQAARCGVLVTSEYVPVTLGDTTYMVDPLFCH